MNAFSGHDQAKGCFSLNGGDTSADRLCFCLANDIKTPQHTRPQDWAHLPYFCRPFYLAAFVGSSQRERRWCLVWNRCLSNWVARLRMSTYTCSPKSKKHSFQRVPYCGFGSFGISVLEKVAYSHESGELLLRSPGKVNLHLRIQKALEILEKQVQLAIVN